MIVAFAATTPSFLGIAIRSFFPMKLLGLQYDVAIAGPDPHHEPNDAGQTVNETSAENRVSLIVMSFATRCLMGIFPTVSLPPSWLSLFSNSICIAMPMSHMADCFILSMTIRETADQARQDRVDDTVGPQVAASSSGGGSDNDDEAGPWKRNNPQQGMW